MYTDTGVTSSEGKEHIGSQSQSFGNTMINYHRESLCTHVSIFVSFLTCLFVYSISYLHDSFFFSYTNMYVTLPDSLFVCLFSGLSVWFCVCLCVCLSVCVSVCVISTAKTDEPILMKLSPIHLTDICQWLLSRFLKFRIWWRHGGHFAFLRCGTLTVAILVRFSSNLDTSFSNACRCLLLKISKIGQWLSVLQRIACDKNSKLGRKIRNVWKPARKASIFTYLDPYKMNSKFV